MPELLDLVVPRRIPLDIVLEVNTAETPLPTVLKLVRNDTTDIRATIRDLQGNVVDITGATPRLRIRRLGTTTVLVTWTGSVVAPGTNGVADFPRVSADYGAGKLDARGLHEGEAEVTFTDGKIGSQFERILIILEEDFD